MRFAKSIPPQTIDRNVSDGGRDRICPQAYPYWIIEAEALALNVSFEALRAYFEDDPRTDEDCLLLDIFAPKPIFDKANGTKNGTGGCR